MAHRLLLGEKLVFTIVSAGHNLRREVVNGDHRSVSGRNGTRHHILVDWTGDGLLEIGSALPQGLFDGRGRRVCSFAIAEGERPLLMADVDLTGHGARDVLLTTIKEGTYKAYLYRNPIPAGPSPTRPAGTGLNYTLY